jgi:hypothetical protein
MGRGFDYTIDRGFDIPWVGGIHDIMGKGFDIPCIVSVKISWVGYLIFHG